MDMIFWIPVVLVAANIAVPIYIWLDWDYGITRFLLNGRRGRIGR